MFVNKLFTYLSHISKNKSCFNVKCLTCYFHIKTKILADFQICISVPLKHCMKVVTNVLILWQVAAVIVTRDESTNALKKALYKIKGRV